MRLVKYKCLKIRLSTLETPPPLPEYGLSIRTTCCLSQTRVTVALNLCCETDISPISFAPLN
jgi:hypothetical protein